jgi:hypothetical protein
MEEKDRGFARVSCFAVEDLETVDLDGLYVVKASEFIVLPWLFWARPIA